MKKLYMENESQRENNYGYDMGYARREWNSFSVSADERDLYNYESGRINTFGFENAEKNGCGFWA